MIKDNDNIKQYGKFQALIEMDARRVATDVYNTLGTRYGVAEVPYHEHNGVDSPNIPWENIQDPIQYVHWTLPGTSAATAGNYGIFWIAPAACTVVGFQEVHQVASTSGTLQLERLQGTEAPDSGDALLSSVISLSSTANTVQIGTVTLSRTNGVGLVNLSKGDRLALKDAGTLTNQNTVSVVVAIQF